MGYSRVLAVLSPVLQPFTGITIFVMIFRKVRFYNLQSNTSKSAVNLTDVTVKAHGCEYHYKSHDPRKGLQHYSVARYSIIYS
jgi:hypothetical protein